MTDLQRVVRHDIEGATGPVVSMHLKQGERPVVVLDRALLESIDATMDSIASDCGDAIVGFVLASDAPRAFIAGANLKEIMDLDDPGLHDYLEYGSKVYRRLSELPCTTVAAIDGACLGGGLEIAMHCDILLAADPGDGKPYPVGLPEAGLSICPGWGGTNMLTARMDPARAIELTAIGKPMRVPDAAAAGLVELVAGDNLLDEALRRAAQTPKAAPSGPPRSIAGDSGGAAGAARTALDAARASTPESQAAQAVLACVEAGLDRGWDAALQCERDNLVRLRSTGEGKAAIEAFFAKSAAR